MQIDDRLIHLQLLKFSVNNMLQYFLQTTGLSLTLPYAREIDTITWKVLLDYWDVPEQDRFNKDFQSVFC